MIRSLIRGNARRYLELAIGFAVLLGMRRIVPSWLRTRLPTWLRLYLTEDCRPYLRASEFV